MTPYRRPSRRSLAEIAVRVAAAAPTASHGGDGEHSCAHARERVVITTPDGVPHKVQGMLRPLTVTAGSELKARNPEAHERVLRDGRSLTITPALQAGKRIIRVENAATRPYEIAFVRRHPGKTTQDLVEWLRSRNGAPPGEIIGGVMPLARGVTNFVSADFPAGDYTLLCFKPDATDGKRRLAHGVVREMRVA